jgi:basic amino acid/polyamine antiporter, APA family
VESLRPERDVALTSLRRTLSFWQVSLSGIGVILGAGVYALIGPAAAQAGSALWLAFLLAGVTAGLTAYAYARLSRLAPKNSPEFQYTALAFGPQLGFVSGALMLIADVLGAAAVTIGFGGYVKHLVGTPITLNALALIVVVGAIIWSGVEQSVAIAIVLTGLEALGLVFVIVVGLPSWAGTDYLAATNGFTGISGAAALIFFAYLGFDELGNFAEEMHRPERDLPRALFVAMVVTTAIYVLVALSAVAVVSPERLAASEAPLALVAERVLGARADAALSVLAMAATANTALLLLVSASRSIYGMAAAGVLPRRLAHVGRTAVPLRSTLLVLGLLAALVLVGTLRQVAAMTDAAVLVSFILVNASLPWLAARRRTPARGVARAVEVLVPTVAVLLCGWLLLHAGATSVIVVLGLAAVMFALTAARRAPGPSPVPRLEQTP